MGDTRLFFRGRSRRQDGNFTVHLVGVRTDDLRAQHVRQFHGHGGLSGSGGTGKEQGGKSGWGWLHEDSVVDGKEGLLFQTDPDGAFQFSGGGGKAV